LKTKGIDIHYQKVAYILLHFCNEKRRCLFRLEVSMFETLGLTPFQTDKKHEQQGIFY
jgi:lipoate-protein ligase B